MSTTTIPALYRSLHEYLVQRIPDDCDSRLTNLIWLMMGMFQARSVQLNLAARKVPIRAKKLSIVRRFERFLKNDAVRVRDWYHPFASSLLQAAAVVGNVRLIVDASKVSHGHRLLMVSLAYRHRSLPIAWTWVRSSREHSSTTKQVKLLAYVYGLLPPGIKVSLVGDCEFDHPLLIENLRFWGWDYALRQPGNHLVMTRAADGWQRLDSFTLQPGTNVWFGNGVLTQANGAGLTNSASVTVKIDQTPPVVTVSTDKPTYTRVDPFVVHFTGSDPEPGSGLASVTGDFNGQFVTNGQTLDLFWFNLGIYEVKATAKDNAGLTTTSSAPFELIATLDSLQATVDRLCKNNFITNKGICLSLSKTLDAAEAAQKRGLTKAAIDVLKAFQLEVKAQSGKHIKPEAANILLMDSTYIIQTLSNTLPVLQKLTLTPMCSTNPAKFRVWRVSNPNATPLIFTWDVVSSGRKQLGIISYLARRTANPARSSSSR